MALNSTTALQLDGLPNEILTKIFENVSVKAELSIHCSLCVSQCCTQLARWKRNKQAQDGLAFVRTCKKFRTLGTPLLPRFWNMVLDFSVLGNTGYVPLRGPPDFLAKVERITVNSSVQRTHMDWILPLSWLPSLRIFRYQCGLPEFDQRQCDLPYKLIQSIRDGVDLTQLSSFLVKTFVNDIARVAGKTCWLLSLLNDKDRGFEIEWKCYLSITIKEENIEEGQNRVSIPFVSPLSLPMGCLLTKVQWFNFDWDTLQPIGGTDHLRWKLGQGLKEWYAKEPKYSRDDGGLVHGVVDEPFDNESFESYEDSYRDSIRDDSSRDDSHNDSDSDNGTGWLSKMRKATRSVLSRVKGAYKKLK